MPIPAERSIRWQRLQGRSDFGDMRFWGQVTEAYIDSTDIRLSSFCKRCYELDMVEECSDINARLHRTTGYLAHRTSLKRNLWTQGCGCGCDERNRLFLITYKAPTAENESTYILRIENRGSRIEDRRIVGS